MEKKIDFFNLLKNEGKLETLYVYPSVKTETDPYEHTKEKLFLNPLPIKALIRQVSWESLKWKYPGLIPNGSIEVIAEKKYETLFQTADKIKYGDNYYKCWKDDSQNFMIMKRSDYIVVILGLKNDKN
jgi:hypothetical protein